MYTTESLMKLVSEKVKSEYGTDTAYRIAKVLEVTQTTVSRWQHGMSMDDSNAFKIAVYLDLDIMTVLASLHAERNKDTLTGEVWEAIAEVVRQHDGERRFPKMAA